jgi:endonuclease YncB( thermonuclease family)
VTSADTIVLSNGIKVRYAGLESVPLSSPWFDICRKKNAYLVYGKRVVITEEPGLSQEGTAVAYVYTPIIVEGGQTKYLFVNAELVRFGYVKVLPVPATIKHKELWQNLWECMELEAKPLKSGIWSGEIDHGEKQTEPSKPSQ